MKKSIAVLLIVCAVLLSTLGAVVSGVVGITVFLDVCNYPVYVKLKSLYSGNENFEQGYVTVTGIDHYDDFDQMYSYGEAYQVFSSEPLDINVGDSVGFTYGAKIAYEGQVYPIVELRRYNPTIEQDEVLLEFAEGKANLLKWVEDEFSPKLFKWCI